jgi:murein DD-endopeptidase MepM/ murein hydrolase activator NlpD
MVSRIKGIVFIVLGICGAWVGKKMYVYFTYQDKPEIIISGMDHSKAYKGEIECKILGDTGYKISQLSATIDGKQISLKDSGRIGRAQFEVPFSIDTTSLQQGEHSVCVVAEDASYNRNKAVEEMSFDVDNIPLKAALLKPEYKVDQGRTVHLLLNTNKENAKAQITFLAKTYEFFPRAPRSTTYECFIPIECEEPVDEHVASIDVSDSVGNTTRLSGKVVINKSEFKKQVGFAIAQGKLDGEKEISISSKVLDQALDQWLEQSPKEKLWSGSFIEPIKVQRIATPYGEIRTTREKGRYQHRAVDLINTPRSVVWATQSGKIIIKDRYLMSGNTIAIDHGYGIVSLYYHLNDFADIEVGDSVKKGNPVGTLGMTGYASGYHLHWELRVKGVPVDPLQWTEQTF